MTKSTDLFCLSRIGTRRQYFTHFYPSANVIRKLVSDNETILKAKVTENHEQREDQYWAWWSSEREAFVHVYHSKKLLEICFPYGLEAAENAGQGKAYPVSIEILEGSENDATK